MLFNSLEFIFCFLPLVWLVFRRMAKFGNLPVLIWLSASSYVFYGIWDWKYVSLLAGSTLVNFALGRLVLRGGRAAGFWCGTGVTLNLLCLAVFKYAGFLVLNGNSLFGTAWQAPDLKLPPGISFFTFTQIAYLIDARRGAMLHQGGLASYSLFVNWFPHLIAGPVLHHGQMIPQFQALRGRIRNPEGIASGLTLLSIGLAKKLLIADPLSLIASPVFDAAAKGMEPTLWVAWYATLAYSFQIYFDFSGYSDMAVGISRLFRIELPVNFRSPYQASSIIDFWRRWHISLSSFLRDYLYIPLGGNRGGRHYRNLMIAMLLGGLWHGASWGFVLWGGLHGVFLIINHLWRGRPRTDASPANRRRQTWLDSVLCLFLFLSCVSISHAYGWITGIPLLLGWLWRRLPDGPGEAIESPWISEVSCRALTFIAVALSWVVFRSENLQAVSEMLQGVCLLNGGTWQSAEEFSRFGIGDVLGAGNMLFLVGLVVWFAPDSNQLAARLVEAGKWGALAAGLTTLLCLFRLGKPSEFLYFQF